MYCDTGVVDKCTNLKVSASKRGLRAKATSKLFDEMSIMNSMSNLFDVEIGNWPWIAPVSPAGGVQSWKVIYY